MLDLETRQLLASLQDILNDAIDKLILKRDNAVLDKYPYRYVCRKMEQALGKVHEAQEKFE